MHRLLGGLLVGLALAAPGCVAWRSHLDPGVAGFPESVRRTTAHNLRLRVTVESPPEDPADDDTPRDPRTPTDTDRLVDLILDANLVREAHPDLAFADGALTVRLAVQGHGPRWAAMLTLATAGLVPFFGGRTVTAEAELHDAGGELVARWTSRAEVRLVAHLLLLTGWNTGVVEGVREDALKSVVARLAEHLEHVRTPATR